NDCSSHGRPEPRDEEVLKPLAMRRLLSCVTVRDPRDPGPYAQREPSRTTRRMTSKPSAGLPPANEKYKRRTAYLDTSIQRDGSDAGRRECLLGWCRGVQDDATTR